ncbi:MAG: DUF494 family protein [Deltaproteobacteria bacterium]|nr:DUF494 family protein [Deltaproteobacteria bacterium]
MKKRVWEIVTLLIQHILEEGDIGDEEVWRSALTLQGYSRKEIVLALSWLKGLIRDTDGKVKNRALRVFNPQEKVRLSREARNFILKLKGMGLIDNDLQEEIIESALLLDIPMVGKEEIKIISAMILSASLRMDWKKSITRIMEENWKGMDH